MCIKINLLPRGLRPRKALIALDYRVVVALVFIIVAAGLVGYYLYIVRNLRDEEAELNNWKQAELMLKNTVDLQNEVNTLREDVAKRVNIIKELTSDSDLRFSILQYINNITPENLWLLSISEVEGENNRIFFNIEGMSYYKEDISAFLASLQEYDKFRSVSLESIRPAPLEIRDAYQYSVRVEPAFTQIVAEETPQTDARRGRR